MGSSCVISCKNCNYFDEFFIGVGMMYFPYNLMDFTSEFALLPNLIKSKTVVEYIKKLLDEKNAVIADGYEHKIYQCPRCNELYDRFFIQLDYDGGSYEVEYKCDKCKTVLRPIEYRLPENSDNELKQIDFTNSPCPRCGKNSLYESQAGLTLWD